MSFPEKFRFSEQAQNEILKMLEAHGFSLPHDRWLTMKLHDIESTYQWSTWRRDRDTHKANIRGWKELQEAISLTIGYLDRQGPELCSPTISDEHAGIFDSWADDLQTPIWNEDFEKHLVQPAFTKGDIEISRRVMQYLLGSATNLAGGLEKWFASRPVKKARPELDGLIRGLTRLWCVAFKIPVANVQISTSAGSPVMNFIEASVQLFLGKTPSRTSIETHVIAYREEEKAKLS